jgi:NADPH:quinone reductase-like Zn-dependent oxidoreductase
MKAAVLQAAQGQPEYADFAEPTAGEGHQLVELVAAGLHQLVRARAHGRHYSSQGGYPLIPGVDAVARTTEGALIYTGNVAAPYGTMAERIAVPHAFHFELPAGTGRRPRSLGRRDPRGPRGGGAEPGARLRLGRARRDRVRRAQPPEWAADASDTSYVQIGALAGPDAALPAALLRSRRIRVLGSGLGSVSRALVLSALPEYVVRIAEGHVEVAVESYPLSEVAHAWTATAKNNARIVLTA